MSPRMTCGLLVALSILLAGCSTGTGSTGHVDPTPSPVAETEGYTSRDGGMGTEPRGRGWRSSLGPGVLYRTDLQLCGTPRASQTEVSAKSGIKGYVQPCPLGTRVVVGLIRFGGHRD